MTMLQVGNADRIVSCFVWNLIWLCWESFFVDFELSILFRNFAACFRIVINKTI